MQVGAAGDGVEPGVRTALARSWRGRSGTAVEEEVEEEDRVRDVELRVVIPIAGVPAEAGPGPQKEEAKDANGIGDVDAAIVVTVPPTKRILARRLRVVRANAGSSVDPVALAIVPRAMVPRAKVP